MARRREDENVGLAEDLRDPEFAREFLLGAKRRTLSCPEARSRLRRDQWFRLPSAIALLMISALSAHHTLGLQTEHLGRDERVQHCANGIDIGLRVFYDTTVSNYRESYTISNADGVTAAWMEWWMRPKRYIRESVPVQSSGSTTLDGWRRADVDINDHPKRLDIGLVAPSMFYAIEGGSPPYLAPGVVDRIEVGEGPISPGELGTPYPEIDEVPVRVVERDTALDVLVTGRNFTKTTRMALLEAATPAAPENNVVHVDESKWIVAVELPMVNLDFGHARVTLPDAVLNRPRLLALAPFLEETSPEFVLQRTPWVRLNVIYVVGADSPVIDSIEPGSISTSDDVTVTVRGHGFSSRSLVATAPNLFEAATFVSPSELRFQWIGGHFYEGPQSVWIADDDFRRMSEPKSIDVRDMGPGRKLVPPPHIRSIAPYPIPLMDYRSPKRLQLRVTGEFFSRETKVYASSRDFDSTPLRTTFVSSTELHAWLPRELWYWGRSSYRFVVEHHGGTCAVEVNDIDPDYRTFSSERR